MQFYFFTDHRNWLTFFSFFFNEIKTLFLAIHVLALPLMVCVLDWANDYDDIEVVAVAIVVECLRMNDLMIKEKSKKMKCFYVKCKFKN